MQHEDRFLLIDGHHLFHRTYNALPRSIVGRDGAPIQGVYGFAGAFLRLVRRFTPTHVCVPFDPPEPPFRRALFPEYRTGRPRGTEEEVANFDAQVQQVFHVLDHMDVCHPMVGGYEADDVMGTLAVQAAAASVPTTIVSGDRDLLQLVGPHVTVFMPKGQEGETWTAALVQERWGVSPTQFIDLKALIGDTSDHIPGVPGIGPRTAATLLAQHGDIDALYAALSALPARQAALLETHRERVLLNRRLVTIVTTLDVSGDLHTYRWAPADEWTASALLAAVGLRG
ncbi:MAG TPA: 5'-3' exonuclease H3TH domain-containing protein [Chloroflexota bacterium]|jgi:DNA polymerase-1|nr:5'-3' exonuclease H3TH domain-containing protein [Chloroflexota bacterium]